MLGKIVVGRHFAGAIGAAGEPQSTIPGHLKLQKSLFFLGKTMIFAELPFFANLTFKGAQDRHSRANLTVKCVPNRRSRGSWTVSSVPKRRSEANLAASFPLQRRSRANLPLRILQNVGPGRTGLQISVSKRGYRVQRCCFQPPTAIVCKTVAGAPRQGSINETKLLSVQLNDQGDKRSSVDGYRREISSIYIYNNAY